MIFNEAAAQGFCCIQKLPPQSSREFRIPGQEGAIWEGSQMASRPPFITNGNTGEEGLCLRGEKESAFPTPHTNNKSHLACKYLTRCSEWWTVANEKTMFICLGQGRGESFLYIEDIHIAVLVISNWVQHLKVNSQEQVPICLHIS